MELPSRLRETVIESYAKPPDLFGELVTYQFVSLIRTPLMPYISPSHKKGLNRS